MVVMRGFLNMKDAQEENEQTLKHLFDHGTSCDVQSGVDIVPVYGLGHTQLFTMLDKSSALGGFLMRMSRRFKVWFGADFNVGLAPTCSLPEKHW